MNEKRPSSFFSIKYQVIGARFLYFENNLTNWLEKNENFNF